MGPGARESSEYPSYMPALLGLRAQKLTLRVHTPCTHPVLKVVIQYHLRSGKGEPTSRIKVRK